MQKQGIKLELGLVEDLKQSALKLNARASELKSQIDNVKQYIKYAEDSYSAMLNQRNDFSILERNYITALKELGIENKEFPEVTKAKSEMNAAMKLFGQEIKK